MTVPGSASTALTWSSEYHPDQPGHGSLSFSGGQNPLHGAYLTTGSTVPLNKETFSSGYTIEAFVKIPLDWNGSDNAWMALLSRGGAASQAGKTGPGSTPQGPSGGTWHLAVVNDGRHTVMYVEGSPTVDNPTLIRATGITQLGLPWLLGGYDWAGSTNQIFHGFIGDVRIVNRPLRVGEFMIAK